MKVAIVGGGNMGGAIARGLTLGTKVTASCVTVADRSEQTLSALRDFDTHLHTTTDNAQAVQGADLVIVAVKPWLMEEVLAGLKPVLDYHTQSIVSIAAGVTFAQLQTYLDKGDGQFPVLYRVIPNTAISLRESVTFVASCGASTEQKQVLFDLLGEMGLVVDVTEAGMIAGTSLSSCGIAFVLKYIEDSINGGVELGFAAAESREIVMQTVRGALALLDQNGTMPRTEIDKVTTPGGITLKGLQAMDEAGFTAAVLEGLHKSR